MAHVSVDAIDALLPQTQCTRCGYDACRPYAEAIAAGKAAINRCPPGGRAGIERLAALLETDTLPLDPGCGEERSVEVVARIVEEDCIGCTKCIQACPVDAIVGALNLMHSVISEECNGCELCIPPCPVDCIELEPSALQPPPYQKADHYRERFKARNARLARLNEEQREQRRMRARASDPVAAALARARLPQNGSQQ